MLLRAQWGARDWPAPPVTVHVEAHNNPRRRGDGFYRPEDADNLVAATKALRDALVDLGVVPDDRVELMRLGRAEIHQSCASNLGGVRVTLEWGEA